MQALFHDLRYAFRGMRRDAVVTTAAILCMALGIGANTCIFGLIESVLMKPLPVEKPQELVSIGGRMPYPWHQQVRQRNQSVSDMCAVAALDQMAVSTNGTRADTTQRAIGRLVSGNYFSLFGVQPAVGRLISDEDNRQEDPRAVAVISYEFWERQFAFDRSIVGRTIALGPGRLVWGWENRRPKRAEAAAPRPNLASFTIIGVAPADFFGETLGDRPDVWLPMSMQAQVMPGRDWVNNANVSWVRAIGRLKPGVTAKKAEAELGLMYRGLWLDDFGPAANERLKRAVSEMKFEALPAARGLAREEYGKNMVTSTDEFTDSLLMLMAIVGIVLLIACANVANLLIARAAGRQKELAVRLAVGARRRDLVRQLLIESLVLSFAGGLLGLLIAAWGTRLLVTQISAFWTTPLEITFRPDLRILGFTAGVSLLTGILFGLAPAFRATRIKLNSVMKQAGSQGGRQRAILRKSLVVVQVALSLLLVLGAGLFVGTLRNLWKVDIGYERENLLIVRVDPGSSGYQGAAFARVASQMRERLAAIPGVKAATYSENGLFSGPEGMAPIILPGDEKPKMTRFDQAGPSYFSSIGIPILRGRALTESDAGAPLRAVVVNEAFARRFFPNENPIGKEFYFLPRGRLPLEIVGVARNAQDHALRWGAVSRFYVPFEQALESPTGVIFELRTGVAPKTLIGEVKRAIAQVDSTVPVLSVNTLEERINRSLLDDRLIAGLCGFFAVLALLLSCVGLYGVMSFNAARRVPEIGIRMALGARRASVLIMVLRESLVLVLIGAIIGLPLAIAASRFIESRLFGLKAADPMIAGIAVAVLFIVGGLAGYLPARRASRVEPVVALRYE